MSDTNHTPSRPITGAASLSARDVLAAAWPLFQVCLPACLPLAIVGVAASAVPGAEAAAGRFGEAYLRSPQWWGLYAASTVLMLLCYGGVLRQQLALARGERVGLLDSLRLSLRELLPSLALVLMSMTVIAVGTLLLVAPGIAAVVLLFFAWPALLAERLNPLAAIQRSIALVRGRFMAVAGVVGALAAAVLVFVLLTGILMAIIMTLAGPGAQTGHAGLSFSRLLMAAVLAVPVVYVGAVSVVAYRAAAQPPHPSSP